MWSCNGCLDGAPAHSNMKLSFEKELREVFGWIYIVKESNLFEATRASLLQMSSCNCCLGGEPLKPQKLEDMLFRQMLTFYWLLLISTGFLLTFYRLLLTLYWLATHVYWLLLTLYWPILARGLLLAQVWNYYWATERATWVGSRDASASKNMLDTRLEDEWNL